MGDALVRLIHSKSPTEAAAATVVAELTAPSPRLAIAGGSVLTAVGAVRRQLGTERFGALRLCWADERCVPLAHPESNRGSAYRAGYLDAHKPPLEELVLYRDDETQVAACERARKQFENSFENGLDVALLGLGEDGHIASLFPGRSELDSHLRIVSVSGSPKPPPERITLTLRSLNTARLTVILATGEAKRHAIKQLLLRQRSIPASLLEHVVVVTDLEL